jgi:isopentenyl diphosphate isomerase/L-lactate dehydrogenase-like FMN-dependent dehydrogenase
MPSAKLPFSVREFRCRARRALPPAIFDFVDGGAEDERTLRRNEAAFGEVELLPRPLEGTTARDQGLTLFGARLSLPVIVGPIGLAGLLWPDGELATARAAAAAGTAYCLSHGSTCTIEDLAAAGASPRWMQVFVYRDRGLTRPFAERAQAAGYDALVLTTDNQALGNRERDLRNGFTIPPRFTPASTLGMLTRAPWLWRMRRQRGLTFANYAGAVGSRDIGSLAARMAGLLDPAASWADVAWLRSLWPGPLLLKGVLHPDEARRAVAEGVDGLVVSNHGGRQLDGAPASIDALPAVADAVAGRAPVLLDGGVRRGADVVKALALGATACLIGRPHLWGLAVGGEAGVAAVLDIYRREIDRVMALGGWDKLEAIGRGALHGRAPITLGPELARAAE